MTLEKNNILANPQQAWIGGSTPKIKISLSNIFAAILSQYGMEAGLDLIDQSLHHALTTSKGVAISDQQLKRISKSMKKETGN